MPALIATPDAFSGAFNVSHETLAKFVTYATLLTKWQKTINLVAPSTLDVIWHRHFADSAQLVPLALDALAASGAAPRPSIRWVDLGSGAGFPGMVAALMLSNAASTSGEAEVNQHRLPSPHVTLIESDQRKSAFLREVARKCSMPVEILSIRIESAATQSKLVRPHVVSARALAPLDKLLHLAAPLFVSETIGLFLKGREAEREVDGARQHWDFGCELRPSLTDAAGRVVVVRNLKPLAGR